MLGPKGTAKQYKIFRNISTPQGGKRLSFQYTIGGLTVIDGVIVAYVDNKNILRKVISSLPRDIEKPPKPRISKKQLIKILLGLFKTHPSAENYIKKMHKIDHQLDVRTHRLRPRKRYTHPFPLTSTPKMVLKRTEHGLK